MYKFDEDFYFGFSFSGFQFEMGGKESIDNRSDWYKWVHNKDNVNAGIVSGDVPDNGPNYWELYKTDHDILEDAGVNMIRLGIEWSRIFPITTEDVKVDVIREDNQIIDINFNEDIIEKLDEIADKKALNKYIEFINDLKKRNIDIMLNLNHFTLPVWLHDPINVNRLNEGPMGWAEEKSVVEFTKFAYYVSHKLNEMVDYWSTLNEPNIVAMLGYLKTSTGFPPAHINIEYFKKAVFHEALAHCRAYDAIRKHSDKPIGIIYATNHPTPQTKEDEEVIENAKYVANYYFLDMITKGMVDYDYNGKQHYRKDMQNKTDFIGVNYYSRSKVKKGKGEGVFNFDYIPGFGQSCNPNSVTDDGYPTSNFGWETYPEGIKGALLSLHERYNLPLIVTENGISDKEDRRRTPYLISHLIKINEAIEEGANVFGYLHWAYMDNFEWASGYNQLFGMVQIDFETKQRTPRPSFYVYKEIIKNKAIKDNMINIARFPFDLIK